MKEIWNIRRENSKSATISLNFTIKNVITSVLGTLSLFGILPAVLYCCSDSPESPMPSPAWCETKVSLSHSSSELETMDVFVFNDDLFQKLDSYQRFENMKMWNGAVASGSGGRIVTVIANSHHKKEHWYSLSSRSHLKSFSIRLEDEDIHKPVMFGECTFSPEDAGSTDHEVVLKPLSAEVMLQSISCDFTGRPYVGEQLHDVKVYLTNVSAETYLLEDEDSGPSRIINAGKLYEEDLEEFRCKELIFKEIKGSIGTRTQFLDVRFRCYRNNRPEEGPGTPYTRLVIEGTIDGRTYYWPIDINRDTDIGEGIQAGHRYIYDIRITRKGSLDPDIPVRSEDFVISKLVSEWKEKEEYEVLF